MLPILWIYSNKPELIHHYIDQIPDFLLLVFAFDKAVDTFFILSAYLLTTQLIHEFKKNSKISFRNFYIRRFFRIFPVYLFALLLYLVTVKDFHPRLIHNLLFVDNLYNDSIILGGWSLSIEVQFYVILPFLILLLNKLKAYRGLFLGSLVLMSLVVRYFIILNHPGIIEVRWVEIINNSDNLFDVLDIIYHPTYARFGLLILGIIWAFLNHSQRGLGRLNRISKTSATIIFMVSLSLIMLSLQYPAYHLESWFHKYFGLELNIWWLTLHRTGFGLGVLGIVIMIELKLLPRILGELLSRFLSHKVWRLFAQLSLPWYLFHIPIIILSYLLLFRTTNFEAITGIRLIHVLAVMVISMSLTLILSMILHRIVERPMIRKGKSLTRGA